MRHVRVGPDAGAAPPLAGGRGPLGRGPSRRRGACRVVAPRLGGAPIGRAPSRGAASRGGAPFPPPRSRRSRRRARRGRPSASGARGRPGGGTSAWGWTAGGAGAFFGTARAASWRSRPDASQRGPARPRPRHGVAAERHARLGQAAGDLVRVQPALTCDVGNSSLCHSAVHGSNRMPAAADRADPGAVSEEVDDLGRHGHRSPQRPSERAAGEGALEARRAPAGVRAPPLSGPRREHPVAEVEALQRSLGMAPAAPDAGAHGPAGALRTPPLLTVPLRPCRRPRRRRPRTRRVAPGGARRCR
jgi:hypothetical protein